MGLCYGYDIVAERSTANDMVRAVAQHLEPRVRRAVLEAVEREDPAPLATGVAEVDQNASLDLEDGAGASSCLVLQLAAEASQDRKIGCVWTSLRLGVAYAHLSMGAATSLMSARFESDPDVKRVVMTICREGGALLAVLDVEEPSPVALWPAPGRIEPDPEAYDLEDAGLTGDALKAAETDAFCAELLRAAARDLEGADDR